MCDKDGFGTAASARSAADYYLKVRDVPLRLYRCPKCNKIHLTRKGASRPAVRR